MNERIERILKAVREANADAFLLFNHEHSGQPGTRYLSGFSGSESILLITKEEKFIFTDGRYFSQAKEECSEFKFMPMGKISFYYEFAKIATDIGLKRIIVDDTRTYHNQITKLSEKIKNISIVGAENILQKLRIVKDESEIDDIQKSVSICIKSFNELLHHIKEGDTEKELAWKLEKLVRENGAEKISFDFIVASGTNGAKPHARASDKKITKGELITFDFGCFYNGYASDMARTIVLGPVPEKLKEIYETTKTAQEIGIKTAKAGISGAEIDQVCRDYISSKGYGDCFLHGTGHGVGMEVHELPWVSAWNKNPLPENSVITIEPGIYIEGLGGVRIEDDIVLKKNGNVNLGEKLSRDLIVI